MRGLLLALSLVAVAAEARPDATRGKRLRALERRENAYWEAFDNRFREAATAWYEPVRVQKHTGNNEPVRELKGLRTLLRDLVELEKERVAVLAQGGPGALLDALRDTLDEIVKAEAALAGVKKRVWRLLLDPRPSLRREALDVRLHALQRVLRDRAAAAVKALVPSLAKRDGRRFPWRRIGALGALRGADWAIVQDLVRDLSDDSPTVRIATLGVLLAAGDEGHTACRPLLRDPDVAVRRALLQSIPKSRADRWIKPVTRAYLAAHGRFRRDCIDALERLTGRELGDAPEAWTALLEDRPVPESTTVTGRRPAFYRIPLSSERVMFLFEGSFTFTVPADHAVQKTRPFMEWGTWGSSDWKDNHPSHQRVLAAQLQSALEAMPEGAAFKVTMMGHPGNAVGRVSSLERPRGALLPVGPKSIRRARRFVEEHKVAFVHDLDLGLTQALEGRHHDTVVVFGNGEITGGRFCLPELLLADFRRRNRFRRLVVHCVRVCNMGPDAEWLFKELAASTGGTYVWSKAPPP